MWSLLKKNYTLTYSFMWDNFFLAFLITKFKGFTRYKGSKHGRKIPQRKWNSTSRRSSGIGFRGPSAQSTICPLLVAPYGVNDLCSLFLSFPISVFGFSHLWNGTSKVSNLWMSLTQNRHSVNCSLVTSIFPFCLTSPTHFDSRSYKVFDFLIPKLSEAQIRRTWPILWIALLDPDFS